MRLYLRPSQESIELTHALSISTSNGPFSSDDLLKPDLAFIQHPNARSSGWKIELNKMNFNHLKNISYLDLGEFEGNDSIEMAQTTAYLLEKGIVPVIIGADEDYYQSIAAYFQNKVQPFSASWIKPGVRDADLEIWDNLLTLKDLYFIGLQRHLTYLTQAKESDIRSHFTYLSELRKSTQNAEPWLRRSEIIAFDPTTIRRSDFPALSHFLPSGLFSEEAASLARMAGSSERNILFITQQWESGYSEESTTCNFGIAQLLWYFMEGFAMKKMDQENQMRAITEYIVDAEDLKSEICFCKSELTGKWWFRDPQSLGENKTALIPCTYEEYLQTINSQTPERISLIFRQNILQPY